MRQYLRKRRGKSMEFFAEALDLEGLHRTAPLGKSPFSGDVAKDRTVRFAWLFVEL
jgi:hypothetical protein